MASAPLTTPTHHVDDIPSISATLAAGANASNTATPTSEVNRSPSPPTMNPAQLGDVPTPEVSKIEASDFTGVTFKPDLVVNAAGASPQ
ncbi:hypothetical protein A1Q2_03031 [Trichosporon asahii var. asahii CBS 8904]|uniref:Uncharacterized protein n=2 Tax=Trichosporon asahii var. asahii TaxID=189963 RepID=K1VF08_TRIAC|nr:hypothetical protein A1Q1_06912 [Trichosporon asahii var. asahii CBS 2479]EJT51865.1 hypothetical protein A1Q1_06912 [Trichosporon asahii var. asahii CBS 2479]EKD02605.1 hypothetical protein A1Q2_03031 [Trichosporon asahii var. asahii CBS 8904]